MITVIKVGGALLQDANFAVEVLKKKIEGPAVVVHGGGVQITRMLDRMNAQSKFVDGLRVTDEATLCAVSLALMGEVHTDLIHAMRTAGLPAVGIFGAIQAQKKQGPWGLVGANVTADAETLMALTQAGKIPVIPTLGCGEHSLLNINGDETAAAVAVSIGATRLVFMTDVPGVKDAAGAVLGHVTDVGRLLSADFVSGGMLPKLRAVKTALDGGVARVLVGATQFGGMA